MPTFLRYVAFPVELTAEDEAAADRDAMDHVIAAVQHIEARDVTGSLTVGLVRVTDPAAAAPGDFPRCQHPGCVFGARGTEGADRFCANHIGDIHHDADQWFVAYGTGPLAMAKVEGWRKAGLQVESRQDAGGTWVHRPVCPAEGDRGKAAAVATLTARAAVPGTVVWAVDAKAGAA